MGFFGMDTKPVVEKRVKGQPKGLDAKTLHEQGCNLCPLNNAKCKTPKMKPSGSRGAVVYILGAAPTSGDDKNGKPFSDEAGRYVRQKVPKSWADNVRYGNVIKTHPGDGDVVRGQNRDDPRDYVHVKNPGFVETECCRPQVAEDILACKPEAVIVIGKAPLAWIANETHAYLWQGRRFPVTLEGHTFWVYPMVHPYDVLKDRRWDSHVPDTELTWGRAFRKVFRDMSEADPAAPFVHTEAYAKEDVDWVMGEGKSDLRRIEKHIDDCANASCTGIDYETSELRPYNDAAKILTCSLTSKRSTLAFPLDHKEAKWTESQRDQLDDMLTEFFLEAPTIKVAHQLAFEMEWTAEHYGKETLRAQPWGDTISQAYVIDEKQGMLALEILTMQYYGINIKALSSVNRKRMADEPLAKILPYNGLDSKYHRRLFLRQMPIIRELGLEAVYEHQLARVPTLVLTQMQGIPINAETRDEFRKVFEKQQRIAFRELEALPCWDKYARRYNGPMNPGSNIDVKKMLTMLGKPNVGGDEKQLKRLDHPFGKALVKWRKPTKIIGTYIDPITPGKDNSQLFDDGQIRPITSTYKVETWRTSSEDPNIQNWPKRGPNVIIRRVVSKRNMKVVAFDYAGIQARNIAMESEDSAFIQAFFDWYDIHTEWVENFAKRYPKWAPSDLHDKSVFKEMRSGIKNGFVFPSFFGSGAKSIAVTCNGLPGVRKAMPLEVVQELQDDLFDMFPGIRKWQQRLMNSYTKNGYVTGLSGFRRHAPIGFNQIINSPIQADETIIVLSAMNALSELDYKRYQPTMEIHDDLTFIWPKDEVEKRSEVVIREMLRHRFDWINVPLVVERSIGDDWCGLEKAGDFESVGTDDYREVKGK
jgi:DNA polymerase-1